MTKVSKSCYFSNVYIASNVYLNRESLSIWLMYRCPVLKFFSVALLETSIKKIKRSRAKFALPEF